MVVMTLVPPAVLIMLALLHVVAKFTKRTWLQDSDFVMRVMLALLFLIYPGVSNTILRALHCNELANGSSYLVADYGIQCSGPGADTALIPLFAGIELTYGAFQAYAILMVSILQQASFTPLLIDQNLCPRCLYIRSVSLSCSLGSLRSGAINCGCLRSMRITAMASLLQL